jgi:hypothetical protein
MPRVAAADFPVYASIMKVCCALSMWTGDYRGYAMLYTACQYHYDSKTPERALNSTGKPATKLREFTAHSGVLAFLDNLTSTN